MRHLLPHVWPGACLLVIVTTCGCQNCPQCCCNSAAPAAATKGVPVSARSPSASGAAASIKYVATYPKLPPAGSSKDKPAVPPVTDYQQSVTSVSDYPAANALASTERTSTGSSSKATTPADAQVPDGPRFGHDANYHCLVGTLDYSRIQDAWVLRYVSYEEDDRYGGCVTLVAPGRGTALKRGQTVRVEGALIDPESQQLRPAFQVRDIRVEGS